MKLSISFVAVKKISCKTPRSTFGNEELEEAAKLILELEGVINPIVVKKKSLQSYEVVDGAFEYYAAVRAREIDRRQGEMIGVFIIEPETEDVIIKQIQAFREKKSDEKQSDNSQKVDLNSEAMEMFLTNLESRFEKITNQLLEQTAAKLKLENEVAALKDKIADKIEPLEIFNNWMPSEIASRLINAGFHPTKAAQIAEIVEKERKKKRFKSLNEVVERVKIRNGRKLVKGISSEKMLDIIDWWSK
jgi:hypothetical protein